MTEDFRIKEHPYLKFERGRKVTITFDGKQLDAYENETVGTALHASGVRILSRSLKYHRPRGLVCVSGRCSNCLMRVNGVPNVRVCVEPVRDGTVVESQNSFPNVSHDVYSVMDSLDFMFPVGFHYRRFIRPRFMWPIYDKLIRKMAGIGRIPDENASIASTYPPLDVETDVDVAVVGGGPAGLSSAMSAARTEAHVALFDENHYLGGHLAKQTRAYDQVGAYSGRRGFEIVKRMLEEARTLENLKLYPGATVTGFYQKGTLAINRQTSFQELTPKAVVLATGTYERMMLFENNDLPGIFSANGVQTLMHIQGIAPGRRIVVIGGNDATAPMIASELLDSGVSVVAIIESGTRDEKREDIARLERREVRLLSPYIVKSVHGKSRVQRVTVVRVDEKGMMTHGTETDLRCDAVCVCGGSNPAFELLIQAGCNMKYDPSVDAFVPKRDSNMEVSANTYAAGEVCRTRNMREIMLEGSIAGLSAALLCGHGSMTDQKMKEEMMAELGNRRR